MGAETRLLRNLTTARGELIKIQVSWRSSASILDFQQMTFLRKLREKNNTIATMGMHRTKLGKGKVNTPTRSTVTEVMTTVIANGKWPTVASHCWCLNTCHGTKEKTLRHHLHTSLQKFIS